MDKIINEYRCLFQKLNEVGQSFVEKDMAAFNARKGKNYKNELMIVGRAVNGWLYKLSKNTDGIIVENDIETAIDNLSKDLIAEHDEIYYKTEKYNPNRSAFGRVKQILASKITGSKISEANSSILWSNLYKISKWEKGNPSSGLKKAQVELCQKILQDEIDYFKPKVIIFLTGHWAMPFINYLKVENKLNQKQKMEYVLSAGIYNDSKVVVGQHPQGIKQAPHISEILSAINSLSIN